MDYLVYGYLQTARYSEAAQVTNQLAGMPNLKLADFKVGYAATAMPVRYAMERSQWADAANIPLPAGAPPHILAVAVWARGLGLARTGRIAEAEIANIRLRDLENQLHRSCNDYWAEQVRILTLEVMAWTGQAKNRRPAAVKLM